MTEARHQSLATGTVGQALLAIERALVGAGDWDTAHQLIKRTISGPIDVSTRGSLYYGAPAILFLLEAATSDGRDRYKTARSSLTGHVRRLVRERLAAAEQRHATGRHTTFAEYDLFYGLTGLGALLLRCLPTSDELTDLLTYIVRLIHPREEHDGTVPGWWVDHDPDPTLPTPGGHANLGMAHGAAGLLAILALAARHGHRVQGHLDAIERLCIWFENWRQETSHGPCWPQWINREQLRTGRARGPANTAGRPSWCYGTPGIARALQLAAIATGHADRQDAAEQAMAACLTPPQLGRLIEPGICHGIAGLYQTAYRTAADARTTAIAAQLPHLATTLANICSTTAPGFKDDGFLTGTAGYFLVAQVAAASTPPLTRWDICLLIV